MNKTQSLQLELVRQAGNWNAFDGVSVAQSLLDCEEYWEAFMMKNEAFIFDIGPHASKMATNWRELAYLSDDAWESDTLFILAYPGFENKLETCVLENMNADEVSWVREQDLDHNVRGRKILRVWWD